MNPFLFLLLTSGRLSSLSTPYAKAEQNRRLTQIIILDSEIRKQNLSLGYKKLSRSVVLLHLNIKECIDGEFGNDPTKVLPFDKIILKCVGDNYSLVVEFYLDLIFKVRELLKEQVKNDLPEQFCDQITFQCLFFFKLLEMFIDKDFNVLKSFESSHGEIIEYIEEPKLTVMIESTKKFLNEFEEIKELLNKERKFLTTYFQEKFFEYTTKYPESTAGLEKALVLLDRKAAGKVAERNKKVDMKKLIEFDKDLASTEEDTKQNVNLADSEVALDEAKDQVEAGLGTL